MRADALPHRSIEPGDATVLAATELPCREAGNPALDCVEPRALRQRGTPMRPPALGAAPADEGGLVRAEVVRHEMIVQIPRDAPVSQILELSGFHGQAGYGVSPRTCPSMERRARQTASSCHNGSGRGRPEANRAPDAAGRRRAVAGWRVTAPPT